MSLEDLTSAVPAAAEPTPAVETASPAAPAAPAAPERSARDDMDALWDKMHQPREADGKFSPPADKLVEAQKSDATTQATASPASAGEAPKPPVSWPKDKTDAWNALTPEARDFILKRETEFERGFQGKAEKYRPYDNLIDELERRRPQLAAMGITDPHQHYRALAAVEEAFAKDPVSTLAELAKRYRVDLGRFAGQQAHPDARVQELERQIAELSNRERQREEHQQQSMVDSLNREIEEFRKAPENVHFEALKQDIAQLLQSGTAGTLREAYDKAMWLNPDIRRQAIEAERKAEAERAEKAAAEARKKASLNVKSSPAAPGKPTSMRETMAAAWDRVNQNLQ